jgi:hypothetical protein
MVYAATIARVVYTGLIRRAAHRRLKPVAAEVAQVAHLSPHNPAA